jgi:hypothetical protein
MSCLELQLERRRSWVLAMELVRRIQLGLVRHIRLGLVRRIQR